MIQAENYQDVAKHFKGFYTLIKDLNPKAIVSVFYHQFDPEMQGEEQLNEFWSIFTDQLKGEASEEDISSAIDLYATSIHSHSLIEMMSRIMSKMIEKQVPTLKLMMNGLYSVTYLVTLVLSPR